jgi:hypothetical protein
MAEASHKPELLARSLMVPVGTCVTFVDEMTSIASSRLEYFSKGNIDQ